MRRLLALTVLLTLVAGEAAAQCSGSSCSPSFSPAARLLEGWHPAPQWPGWLLHYRAGVVTAGYRPETDAYCTYSATSNQWGPIGAPPWGAKVPAKLNFGVDESKLQGPRSSASPGVGESRQPAPIDLAAAAAAKAKSLTDELAGILTQRETVQNFGVESAQLGRANDRYLLGGAHGVREVSRDEGLRAVGNGGLKDDSGLPRLTVIGPEADRQRVLADFDAAPLAEWKSKLLVQSYPPDHWHVAKAGFKTTGQPTIYLQRPDGLVMHRQDDYAGGAPVLAQAIRKADPNYDPAKDGNLNKPAPAPGAPDWLNNLLAKLPVPPWVAVAIAAAAGLWYFRQPGSAAPAQPLTQTVESLRESPPRQFGYRPASTPPQSGPAMPPPAPIPSRPDLTLGRLLQDQLEREQREEQEAKRRAAEREAERAAFRKFAGLDAPAPNPVPVVPSPDPEKKG